MEIPSGIHRKSVGANMTPMIDVVFLLIIFFLVSSHLARQENRLPLDLPTADSHGPIDLEAAALTISVDQNANWRVGGGAVEEAELQAILQDLVAREGIAAAIRIRTDQNVQYRYVEPILRFAAKVGISDASIAVRD